MRVRITQGSGWYSDRVGEIFEVEEYDAQYFRLTYLKDYFIAKSECEIVKDEPPKGIKYDTEKTRFELLPFEQIEQVAEVLTIGAKKYADDNWKKVMPRSRYIGASLRHIFAWIRGEKLDKETGKSHLAHAVCCLLFLMWSDDND